MESKYPLNGADVSRNYGSSSKDALPSSEVVAPRYPKEMALVPGGSGSIFMNSTRV